MAFLVTVRIFDLLQLSRKGIIAVTMPCFGTTDRTYENACLLAKTLGTTLRKWISGNRSPDILRISVRIWSAMMSPMRTDRPGTHAGADGHANMENALVIGTGDMSELALGWATYNGDHMSMYGVNAGVPKTLVRHLVAYYADTCENRNLRQY